MYQGTMIDKLIEIVLRAEEHAQLAEVAGPRTLEPYEGFVYELPPSPAAMIGVA